MNGTAREGRKQEDKQQQARGAEAVAHIARALVGEPGAAVRVAARDGRVTLHAFSSARGTHARASFEALVAAPFEALADVSALRIFGALRGVPAVTYDPNKRRITVKAAKTTGSLAWPSSTAGTGTPWPEPTAAFAPRSEVDLAWLRRAAGNDERHGVVVLGDRRAVGTDGRHVHLGSGGEQLIVPRALAALVSAAAEQVEFAQDEGRGVTWARWRAGGCGCEASSRWPSEAVDYVRDTVGPAVEGMLSQPEVARAHGPALLAAVERGRIIHHEVRFSMRPGTLTLSTRAVDVGTFEEAIDAEVAAEGEFMLDSRLVAPLLERAGDRPVSLRRGDEGAPAVAFLAADGEELGAVGLLVEARR